jgi:hypothetical protein
MSQALGFFLAGGEDRVSSVAQVMWNSWSSYLGSSTAGIIDTYHHTWLKNWFHFQFGVIMKTIAENICERVFW